MIECEFPNQLLNAPVFGAIHSPISKFVVIGMVRRDGSSILLVFSHGWHHFLYVLCRSTFLDFAPDVRNFGDTIGLSFSKSLASVNHTLHLRSGTS